MIENGQRQMRLAVLIRLDEQIAASNPIAPHRPGHAVLQVPSSLENLILVSPNRVRDVGFTHCHLPPGLPPPIEVMGNGPTASLRHERFQSDDVLLNPLRLGLGEDSARW
jgi:hypothetical protein